MGSEMTQWILSYKFSLNSAEKLFSIDVSFNYNGSFNLIIGCWVAVVDNKELKQNLDW